MVVVWDASWFCVYLIWLLADGFPLHSSDARAEYRVSVCDVFGFEGAVFYYSVSRHFLELGVSGVA